MQNRLFMGRGEIMRNNVIHGGVEPSRADLPGSVVVVSVDGPRASTVRIRARTCISRHRHRNSPPEAYPERAESATPDIFLCFQNT